MRLQQKDNYGKSKTRTTRTNNATNTLSGELTISGGMSIEQDIYIGGNIYNNTTNSETITTNSLNNDSREERA